MNHSVKSETRDAFARSHFGCGRPHERQSADAATSNACVLVYNRAASCVEAEGEISEIQFQAQISAKALS